MRFLRAARDRRPVTRRPLAARTTSAVAALTLIATSVLTVAPVVNAAPGDIGFEGPSSLGAGSASSGSKPESKLWYNDGLWWANLWSASANAFHIWRLDIPGQQWVDTGVAVDTRTGTRADALWDGSKLYILSHRYSTAPAAGYAMRLYRYSYNSTMKTYSLDSGFPFQIHDFKVETAVFDKDSTGTLWATWVQNNQVYVSHSNGQDNVWVTPYVLPAAGTTVDADDISSVIAFKKAGGTPRIGVMWSNQVDNKMHFAFHDDGAPDNVWNDSAIAFQGAKNADDHINLKALDSDSTGRIFAVVKTSQTSASLPLIVLLTFTPSGSAGTWSATTVSRVQDGPTRPIVIIDQAAMQARVYMTGPVAPATTGDSGGRIVEKISSLSSLSFPVGAGTTVMQDADSPALNNVSSTKQNVNSTTGLVLLATNDDTDRYWWSYDTLGGSPPPNDPPVASFTANRSSGPAPLTVQFTDTSTKLPSSWAWDFQDDGAVDSTDQNPTFTYPTPGSYTVRLKATNQGGSSEATKTITVDPSLTEKTFAPAADAFTSQGSPTKNYGTDANLRVRNSSASFRSYLKFNVSGISGTVKSVKLRLWVTDDSPSGGTFSSTSNSWTETGTGSITWNTQPAPAGSPLKTLGATTAIGSWTQVDLGTPISGDGTYSFVIAGGSSNSAYYSSRNGTNPPQLVVGYDAAPPPPPVKPVADFTASPTNPATGQSVQFTDQSTNSPGAWSWDFGDGGTSALQNPTHAYASPGDYSVTLTASNGAGDSLPVKKSAYIHVTATPPPPTTVTFTATADTRPNQASPTSLTGGTDPTLRVRLDPTGSYRTLVRFNVTGITGTISSVKLRLFCTDPSPNGGTAYKTSGSWSEAATNWNNAPAATSGAAGTALNVVSGAWAEFDVTSLVAGNGQVDLLVQDGSSNSAYYSSREGANPPQLVVTTN